MIPAALTRPTGIARRCLTGGWIVDMGDAFPRWVPTREAAVAELDARAPASASGPTASVTALRTDP